MTEDAMTALSKASIEGCWAFLRIARAARRVRDNCRLKGAGSSLGMVLELAKTLASELHDKWEVLEGREQLNKVVAL